ncbi:hypothetical protein LPJ71_003466 [Coemansia sp. S17]|nr:hypothetical protein LPJ71_003466 [Coemansia sp. S17]
MPRIPSGFVKRSASSARQSSLTRPCESSDATASTNADPASGSVVKSSDSTSDGAAKKAVTYWCQAAGQGLLVEFKDSWILELVTGGLAAGAARDRIASWRVVVPGICPFHIVAKQFKGDKTWCGGMFTHAHESQEAGPNFVNEVTDESLVLNRPLVTSPMPMHALIMSPELRAASLYFYFDLKFKASYPEAYANLQGRQCRDMLLFPCTSMPMTLSK